MGLVAGHVALPYAGAGYPATPGRRLAFWGALLGVAAFRGWRDAAARRETGRRAARRAALTALAAAAAALGAYWLVHGTPKGL